MYIIQCNQSNQHPINANAKWQSNNQQIDKTHNQPTNKMHTIHQCIKHKLTNAINQQKTIKQTTIRIFLKKNMHINQ